MNFQAVSVGQKLAKDNFDGSCDNDPLTGKVGGYLDGSGTPSDVLAYGLQKTDEALGSMFSFGDTNVGLIVSNPGVRAGVLKSPVATSQVAPTILEALGLDPSALKSVRVEHTEELPGLPFSGQK